MKTYILIIALSAFQFLQAQNMTEKPGKLSHVTLRSDKEGDHLNFTVSSESNIRQYVVEAGMDTTSFEIIGTLNSQGNSVMPRTYEFVSVEKVYPCYRIRQVDLNGSITAVVKLSAGNVKQPTKIKNNQQADAFILSNK